MNEFEAGIVLWISQHRLPGLTQFNQAITCLNDAGILSILVCLVFLAVRKVRRYGIVMSLSLLMEFVLNNLFLKKLIARTRPYVVESGIEVITRMPSDFSFPSGHSGAGFAVAFAMYLVMPKKWGITALVVAGLISLSRLYVGVHYPTDVLAGVALGILTAIIARYIGEKLMKRDAVRKLL